VILHCGKSPLNLSGAVIRFWTECLKFEVVGWAMKESEVLDKDVEHLLAQRFRWHACLRRMRRKSKFKPLLNGEDPYVDLSYGSTQELLERMPKGQELNKGTGHERLMLTCKTEEMKVISGLVQTLGLLHGGKESKKSFQLVPGRLDLIGIVAHDPNGLEVCYYSDKEVRLLTFNQLDPNEHLRRRISAYKKKVSEKKRGSRGRFTLVLCVAGRSIEMTTHRISQDITLLKVFLKVRYQLQLSFKESTKKLFLIA
ncbi:hypothetical protein Ocin01_08217, partial [Orchesella cincta]